VSRSKTKSDRAYLSRVAELGCIVCLIHHGEASPACIHHLRDGQGMGQRADDRTAIGLCYFHHQGPEGIHTLGTRRWQAKYGSGKERLAKVREALGIEE
jgi:hypothetical protein